MRISWPKKAKRDSLSDADNRTNTVSFQKLWAELSRSNSISRRELILVCGVYYLSESYLFEHFYPHSSPTGAKRPLYDTTHFLSSTSRRTLFRFLESSLTLVITQIHKMVLALSTNDSHLTKKILECRPMHKN